MRTKTASLLLSVAIVSLLLVNTACSGGDPVRAGADPAGGGEPLASDVLTNPTPASWADIAPSMEYAGYGTSARYPSTMTYPSTYYPGSHGGAPMSGIHVIGAGVVTVSPDLATLHMGVEARADTVEEARSEAASAMDAVKAALEAYGIAETDIQTRHFSIHPEYVWRDMTDRERGHYREQVLVGYRVTNTVEVKVRHLDQVGEIIDDAARAGGDAIRVNHVSFTVEDPAQYERQAREAAVKEARAKAQDMASWAGESLGSLMQLEEAGAPSPVRVDMAAERFLAEDAAAPATPISPGELEVRVTVRGVWAIR